MSAPTVRRQTTRAFRVSRDEKTGEQKMIPMDESELDGMMSRGGPAGIKDANYFQKLKDKLGGGKRKVGRCRLTVSEPVLKAPMGSALETRVSCTAFKLWLQF